MSNVLFINLKRNGDIFNTAALAQSYMKENPHVMPYILVYDEFKKATKPLSVFKGVFTLNRKKLTTFCNNDLYSNGFALDELVTQLSDLESISWSEIINYSSDKASTFLTCYLSNNKNVGTKGITFGQGNSVDYKSSWEIIFNDIITQSELSPVHFSTAYHGIADVPEFNGPFNIKRVNKHEETVANNFENLRRANGPQDGRCSLVGIQLSSSLREKDWSLDQVTNIVEEVLDDASLYPIILIAPNNEERELSKQLNERFDNKLIIVESDFIALSSVLGGLDVLITPDTSVKHLGDLNGCKVLEYSNDLNLSLKQGTRSAGNLIITRSEVEATVFLDAIKFLIEPSETTLSSILLDGIFMTYQDGLGWNIKPINGEFSESLFKRQIQRTYISEWTGINDEWDIKRYFADYNYATVQNLIDGEKTYLSEVSRDLLGTLRSLVKASESQSDAKNFMISLDKLLNHSTSKMLASIPVTEFKARLENLNSETKEKQFRSVEDLLYKLKKNIQVALECLNRVEKDSRSMPVNITKGRIAEVTV